MGDTSLVDLVSLIERKAGIRTVGKPLHVQRSGGLSTLKSRISIVNAC
jgi:hypothetical protein